MRQPSIALIFNPAARGEKARRFRESLGQMQDECTLLETTAPGSATSLAAQAIRDGYKTIVASGGDGTVNEVVNGLAKEREGLGQVQPGIPRPGTHKINFSSQTHMRTALPPLGQAARNHLPDGTITFSARGRSVIVTGSVPIKSPSA